MVSRDLSRHIREMLSGIDNAAFEAEEMAREATGFTRLEFMLSKREITRAEICKAEDFARRRIAGEPLGYIIGYTEFMSLKFHTPPSVLIPRGDTETLAEAAIAFEPKTALDIGTGSGALAVSLAYYGACAVSACDISGAALETAKRNADENNVSIRLFKTDILTEEIPGRYDCIISNPPYIRSGEIAGLMKEVRDFEPHTALDGGKDGLVFYRRIIPSARAHLNEGGALMLEIGFDMAAEVSRMMHDAGFRDVKVIKDLCGCDRVVWGIKRTD